ncbi:DUF7317 family protein [Haloplanus sp. C73]|uniref:DUF7317 family protein n=1 Tax=Haloplanus sp. C73 TaxID=3421641 RepID=UPI003EBEAEDA
MHSHSFRSSVTLYRNGTLTLAQAARHAGCSEAAMTEAATTRSARATSDTGGTALSRSVDV